MTDNNMPASQEIKLVTVYASSSAALRPQYYDAAGRLGEVLAGAGKSIIYGAGGRGLMGAMADGALRRNGKIYGVIPGFLQALELTHSGLTGLQVVEDMRVRKHLMLKNSDAVVALPGGSGTYEELFEALTMKRLGQWTGPIVVVNTQGFYDGLLKFLQHSIDEHFMGRRHLEMWSVITTPEDLLQAFDAAQPWGQDAIGFANQVPASG